MLKLKFIVFLIIFAASLSFLLPGLVHAGKVRFPARGSLRIISHDISAQLIPDSSYIVATDEVIIKSGGNKKIAFLLNPALSINSMTVDGKFFSFTRTTPDNVDFSKLPGFSGITAEDLPEGLCLVELNLGEYGKSRRELVVKVSYEGEIYDDVEVGEFSREYIADQTSGIIAEKGVFLMPSTYWYPFVPDGGLCSHRLETITPEGFEVVTQGVLEKHETTSDSLHIETVWNAPHPSEGIHLIAGPYQIFTRNHGETELMVYLYKEDADLADSFLDKSDQFISLYENMLSPYPFGKFAVVDNFFPTGYGMPSYTLIGSAILRLPFLINISLGHEITHNWWGNSVYVDYASGNWCEGLTSYCADYYYREMKGPEAARDYRRGLLRDYADYISPETDFPLTAFTSRTTPGSRAVGYGKAAMVFHQMRRIIGDDAFFAALKRIIREKQWEEASWADFERAFSIEGKSDFHRFFEQWITRKGAPTIHLDSVRKSVGKEGKYRLDVTVTQDSPEYYLHVPVRLVSDDGEIVDRFIDMNSNKGQVSFSSNSASGWISVDPDFDVFRNLLPGEVAPTLSKVLGDENTIFIIADSIPDNLRKAYRDLADRLRHGSSIEIVDNPAEAIPLIRKHPYLLFGPVDAFSDIAEFIPGTDSEIIDEAVNRAGSIPKESLSVLAIRNHPVLSNSVCGIFTGEDPEGITKAGYKLPHYGKYTDLVFFNGRNVGKKVREAEDSPLKVRFEIK